MADVSSLVEAVRRHARDCLTIAVVDEVIHTQADVPHVTNTLANSVGPSSGQVIIHESGDVLSTEITVDAPYAGIVDAGRRTVFPVRAKALHWIGSGGIEVFAMKSGPVPPNPFFTGRMPARWPSTLQSAFNATTTRA